MRNRTYGVVVGDGLYPVTYPMLLGRWQSITCCVSLIIKLFDCYEPHILLDMIPSLSNQLNYDYHFANFKIVLIDIEVN